MPPGSFPRGFPEWTLVHTLLQKGLVLAQFSVAYGFLKVQGSNPGWFMKSEAKKRMIMSSEVLDSASIEDLVPAPLGNFHKWRHQKFGPFFDPFSSFINIAQKYGNFLFNNNFMDFHWDLKWNFNSLFFWKKKIWKIQL